LKTLITFIIATFLTVPLIPQKIGDNLLIREPCNLYEEPLIFSKSITNLNINDTITILQLEDEHGYYLVECRKMKGFLSATKIVPAMKYRDPVYRKKMENWEKLIKTYTSRYGTPDESSEYITDGHEMRTLMWRCAKSKYRSIDFIFINNLWHEESEFTKSCIN
jgi:hypothetical protein